MDEPSPALIEFKLLSATLGVLKQNLCTIRGIEHWTIHISCFPSSVF